MSVTQTKKLTAISASQLQPSLRVDPLAGGQCHLYGGKLVGALTDGILAWCKVPERWSAWFPLGNDDGQIQGREMALE